MKDLKKRVKDLKNPIMGKKKGTKKKKGRKKKMGVMSFPFSIHSYSNERTPICSLDAWIRQIR